MIWSVFSFVFHFISDFQERPSDGSCALLAGNIQVLPVNINLILNLYSHKFTANNITKKRRIFSFILKTLVIIRK